MQSLPNHKGDFVSRRAPAKPTVVCGKAVLEVGVLWLFTILSLPNNKVVFTMTMVAEKSIVVLARPFLNLY
jgi:hypothetical protein